MAFIRRRPKRLVAIDWDASVLRVVHTFISGKTVKIDRLLSSAFPADLDQSDVGQMGRHIRRTLDQEGITTKHAIVDIPRDQAILKTLRLPTGQPDELPGMVEIQIAKELPFPVLEAVVDFTTEGTSTDEATGEVLVAAVRREVLAHYEAIFEVAELKLDRVGLRPYANKVAVVELLKHGMPERVLFIDVRPTFMEIDVIRQSALVFSRSASVTIPADAGESQILSISKSPASPAFDHPRDQIGEGDDYIPPGEVVQSLLLEVTRSIEAYRASDPGAVIEHAVIGGDVGVEEALAEAIQTRLKITTEIYNPASTFGWEPDEGANAAAFSATLGLVLSQQVDSTGHFDFLHPKKSVSVARERLKKAPLVAAVLAMFVVATGVGLGQMTKRPRERLAKINAEISRLEDKRKKNKRFLAVLEEVRAFDSRQQVWIDELYNVISTIPSNEEIVINHIDVKQKQSRITLKTMTKRRDTADRTVQDLQAFRREDRDAPRYKVSVGTQTEKKGQKYPFYQDLRIFILDDSSSGKKPKGNRESG